MPFTPFHMGPGILLKAALQGSFSLMVFGWAQIVMDLQPLLVLLTGEGHLHGFSHTYVGATLIGIACALSGKYAGQWGLRFLSLSRHGLIRWRVAMLSAFIGTYSHVLLDSLMHGDLEPFSPWSAHNPFLDLISVEAVHRFCLYSGLLGAALYFLFLRRLKKRVGGR